MADWWQVTAARMLPEKRRESDEGGSGRGGFEVHVIGGQRTGLSEPGEKGLEMGLRIGGGNARERVKAESSAGPVHRLEAEAEDPPLHAKPMSGLGPAEPRVASAGRRKSRRGLGHWTVWMAAATCSVVVAAVGGMMLAGKKRQEGQDRGPAYVVEPVQKLDPREKYFVEHSGELIAEAEAVLGRYAAAASVEEALPLVRDAERVRERMIALWKPWGTAEAFAPGEDLSGYITDNAGRPGIGLAGRKGDFSRFEVFFVREGERMMLDWEASEGIGEVQIAELHGGAGGQGGVVRATIRPSTFHTADFPEDGYRSYQLSDAAGKHSVWGFAPQGSPVAEALDAEFNEGSVLFERNEEIRAAVRLAGSAGGSGKCYEITEMLHKGWVTP